MRKCEYLPVTLPVSKRVELTTICESDDPLAPMRRHGLHEAIGRHFSWQTFEQSRHCNARIPSKQKSFISISNLHEILEPLGDFFESINSSQASQIRGVENCVGS